MMKLILHSISLLLLIISLVDAQLDINFVLYSATGDPVESIKDGTSYDQSVVGTALTVIVQFVGSPKPTDNPMVNFTYGTEERMDTIAPFSLSGDANGPYTPSDYLTSVGAKTITATVYDAKNVILITKTISFTLTNSGAGASNIMIDGLFLVRANVPKRESLLSQISEGKIIDLTKVFETEPSIPQNYPLPLALYLRFKGPIQATSVTFNFFYNNTSDDQDKTDGMIGRLNSQYDVYDILPDLAQPGLKTVTINCYDGSSSPLIFTKTYHFTLLAATNFQVNKNVVVTVAPIATQSPQAAPTTLAQGALTPIGPSAPTSIIPPVSTPTSPATSPPVAPAASTPMSPAAPTPMSPAAPTPIAPTARKPIAPTARKPIAPTARKPIAPAARKPIAPRVRKPIAPAARKPIAPRVRKPIAPRVRKPRRRRRKKKIMVANQTIPTLIQNQTIPSSMQNQTTARN